VLIIWMGKIERGLGKCGRRCESPFWPFSKNPREQSQQSDASAAQR